MGLFALDRKRQWKQIPLQIDPMDHRGRLVFFNKGEDFLSFNVDRNDRISFYDQSFGQKLNPKDDMPCKADFYYEIETKDKDKKYAYVMDCSKDQKFQFSPFPPRISHDQEKMTMFSPLYDYNYHESNHMMFNRIWVKPEGSKKKIEVGYESAQRIRADVKRFFTMNFSQDDIESKLIDVREGPVAMLGKLTFFLHILFFKIDMQLNTIVSFYEDAVHMPMTINMPVHTHKVLNPRSGMNFTWKIPDGVVWNKEASTIKSINVSEIAKGYKELAKYGLKNCKFGRCQFMLSGMIDGFEWGTEFFIPRPLVARGFFPMFIEKVPESMKELGWDEELKKTDDNIVGVYFETSGLEKGQHEFDFWIKIGSKKRPVTRKCPTPVRLKSRKPASERIKKILALGYEDILLTGKTSGELIEQSRVIKDQSSWDEVLDQLDYDVDIPPHLLTVDFKRYQVILVSASSVEKVELGKTSLVKKERLLPYTVVGKSDSLAFTIALIKKRTKNQFKRMPPK